MENLSKKNEEFEQENNESENGQERDANELSKEKNNKENSKHTHHGHPHIVTIGHNTHGRTNSRSFGIDHEPGSRI